MSAEEATQILNWRGMLGLPCQYTEFQSLPFFCDPGYLQNGGSYISRKPACFHHFESELWDTVHLCPCNPVYENPTCIFFSFWTMIVLDWAAFTKQSWLCFQPCFQFVSRIPWRLVSLTNSQGLPHVHSLQRPSPLGMENSHTLLVV